MLKRAAAEDALIAKHAASVSADTRLRTVLFYVLLALLLITFALELCFETGLLKLSNPLAIHGLFAALLTALAWIFRRKR